MTHSRTDRAKMERAVITAALLRYRHWKKQNPDAWMRVLRGDDNISGGKLGGNMIRACAKLAGDL